MPSAKRVAQNAQGIYVGADKYFWEKRQRLRASQRRGAAKKKARVEKINNTSPTEKQLAVLNKFGLTADSKIEASYLIEIVKLNGWKLPPKLQKLTDSNR